MYEQRLFSEVALEVVATYANHPNENRIQFVCSAISKRIDYAAANRNLLRRLKAYN